MIFPVLNQFGPFLIHRKSQKKYSSVCIRFECHCMHRMLRGLCKSLYVFKGLFLLSMFKADVATTYPLHWWNWQQFCKHIKWDPLDGPWPPCKHLLLLSVSLCRPMGHHTVKALMVLSVCLRKVPCSHTHCRLQWPRKYRWIAQQNHSHKVEQNAERAYCWDKKTVGVI